jgi:hypothetical protein
MCRERLACARLLRRLMQAPVALLQLLRCTSRLAE